MVDDDRTFCTVTDTVTRRAQWCIALVVTITFGVSAITGVSADGATSTLTLRGAGSTFVFPFFHTIFARYTLIHTDVNLVYLPEGSGRGITDFTVGSVTFGASDVPMNAAELQTAEQAHGPVIQVPVIVGAEAIVYHVPGVSGGLRLRAATLVDIFRGAITFWDDPAITEEAHLRLPHLRITVIYRSDSSGTTYILTDYFSNVSAIWRSTIGTGKLTGWPVGIGGQGNGGVATLVDAIPGAIGYVELSYAQQKHLAVASIENRAGTFIAPSATTIHAAAAQIQGISATHFSIVNAPGTQSYPIVGYSWVLLYQWGGGVAQRQALTALFQWVVGPAQRYATSLGYVPLPVPVQIFAQQSLSTMGSVRS